MKALLKEGVIVLVPEAEDDPETFAAWREATTDHAFVLHAQPRGGTVLHDLGPREVACREPLNVGYRSPDWRIKLISNFAPTPFELDGRTYASIEGFWQGLKFQSEADRRVNMTTPMLTQSTPLIHRENFQESPWLPEPGQFHPQMTIPSNMLTRMMCKRRSLFIVHNLRTDSISEINWLTHRNAPGWARFCFSGEPS